MKLFFVIFFSILIVSSGVFIFLINISLSQELLAKQDFKDNKEQGKVLGVNEINYELGLPMAKDIETPNKIKQKILETIPFNLNLNQNLEISAQKVIAVDALSNKILFAKNADKKTPIASITKLITALTFLKYNPGWETIYEIKANDRRDGGRIYLYNGEKVLVKDLFNLSLSASANTATMAMVHSTSLSEKDFVKEMNKTAKEIGLVQTSFNEPVGLSRFNVSTAREVAQILKNALKHKEIKQALLLPKYSFYTLDRKYKIAYNTDRLLKIKNNSFKMLGGKTGYTELAGYCFAVAFANNKNNEIFVVILDDNNHYSRFDNAQKTAKWVYGNFSW